MTIPRLLQRYRGAYQRRAAKWFGRRPYTLRQKQAIVSFTFDDFPRSALEIGGSILEEFGAVGTYYASFGLMEKITPTGKIFRSSDVPTLLERGHELGCHTFEHCPAWETSSEAFEASCIRNQAALASLKPRATFPTLSYPISCPRPLTKRKMEKYFRACRGGGQTHNRRTPDLNYLSSFFLEQSRDDFDTVRRAIDAAREQQAWLIFSTHDVCDSPTRYGIQPKFFEQVVRYTVDSGLTALTMSAALDLFSVPNVRPSSSTDRDY